MMIKIVEHTDGPDIAYRAKKVSYINYIVVRDRLLMGEGHATPTNQLTNQGRIGRKVLLMKRKDDKLIAR